MRAQEMLLSDAAVCMRTESYLVTGGGTRVDSKQNVEVINRSY